MSLLTNHQTLAEDFTDNTQMIFKLPPGKEYTSVQIHCYYLPNLLNVCPRHQRNVYCLQ